MIRGGGGCRVRPCTSWPRRGHVPSGSNAAVVVQAAPGCWAGNGRRLATRCRFSLIAQGLHGVQPSRRRAGRMLATTAIATAPATIQARSAGSTMVGIL